MLQAAPVTKMNNKPALEAVDLVKHYTRANRERVRAVDGVSLLIDEGQTLGLVGESGCGKSTLVRLLLRLEEPTSGQLLFEGGDITLLRGERLRQWRRNIQVIFQDAYASLNPRMKVGEILAEPLLNYHKQDSALCRERVAHLLSAIGLEPGLSDRYPHEFSGGQRQRIAIGRALALTPRIIVCDEPVASLDVSIQAQILNLLKTLREEFRLTYLFISHDLAVVRYISHRVAVMYLGKIVEVLDSGELTERALHPYTRSLLAAVPLPDPDNRIREEIMIKGEPPNPASPPAGCRFHPRCPQVMAVCRYREPLLVRFADNHLVACHRSETCLP
jgi:oligopeptide/dipeptide ABC transporter ATP-binding protein